ncbi:tRNA lysidine(34) synthetase TilS [Elizabethkingia sp. HvH-WGS333]|uniref:tRNA lysidine(34) synthetase TilS n=1 Tax=Elizabethkingia TaxID=308865 RepID=UPI0007417109|nr:MULTISPECIES: tRNA lysidine(34) synthetase TilS [Elizabethkingia]KUG10100.1 tRNA(Ile)-lysidine synthetase [Elizabethkingia miricola]MCL1655683.1 tRNA lysidine(34) synthetase TilS [Elizabethkingia miricola]MCP1251829.1 tRNA lysidine(34) synthetase TilS [Elizabethkingia sp. S0634]OIK46649.1 tRNA lysidine(34) synthetase TilS [Elizabethkingia sp. HvH-WGS333]
MPQLTSTYLKEHLQSLHNTIENQSFLLALSGGADSMVLADLFLKAGISFEAAHVNYHLRGEDSNLDQQIVEDFCRQHNIILHTYDVSEKDNKPENSIELWAREIRYGFFFRLLEEQKLDFIVMGHHLNDQLETFIINLSKAAGITGLSGIPENNNKILRPLLHITKADIYKFAKENGVNFREDHTNLSRDYLRNQIRHDISPEMEKTNPHFWENFDKSISFLNQAKSFIEEQLQKILDDIIITETNDELILDKEKLASQPDFVRYEILKKYGFTNPIEQQKIFEAGSGSQFKGNTLNLFIHRNQLIITPRNISEEETEQEIILIPDEPISFPEKMLLSEDKLNQKPYWEIDLQKVVLPLKLRRAKSGDFFHPKGMKGKKLVSKFFKDEKISILARQKVWLLSDSEENVVGIINYRQDGRFLPENNNPKIYLYL